MGNRQLTFPRTGQEFDRCRRRPQIPLRTPDYDVLPSPGPAAFKPGNVFLSSKYRKSRDRSGFRSHHKAPRMSINLTPKPSSVSTQSRSLRAIFRCVVASIPTCSCRHR